MELQAAPCLLLRNQRLTPRHAVNVLSALEWKHVRILPKRSVGTTGVPAVLCHNEESDKNEPVSQKRPGSLPLQITKFCNVFRAVCWRPLRPAQDVQGQHTGLSEGSRDQRSTCSPLLLCRSTHFLMSCTNNEHVSEAPRSSRFISRMQLIEAGDVV